MNGVEQLYEVALAAIESLAELLELEPESEPLTTRKRALAAAYRIAAAEAADELTVETPAGVIAATAYESMDPDGNGTRGISVVLRKPDGTEGDLSLSEATFGDMTGCYPTAVHTYVWDGSAEREEDPIQIDVDPMGPAMGYSSALDELEAECCHGEPASPGREGDAR